MDASASSVPKKPAQFNQDLIAILSSGTKMWVRSHGVSKAGDAFDIRQFPTIVEVVVIDEHFYVVAEVKSWKTGLMEDMGLVVPLNHRCAEKLLALA